MRRLSQHLVPRTPSYGEQCLRETQVPGEDGEGQWVQTTLLYRLPLPLSPKASRMYESLISAKQITNLVAPNNMLIISQFPLPDNQAG